ncbi:hypothetical protein ACHAXH_004749 [Discostella pseudostelligera]
MIIICGLHRFSGSQCNSIRFIASRAGALQGRVGDQPKPPPCYFGMRARNNYGSSSSSSPPTPLCQIAHHRYYPSIHFSTFTKSEYIHPLSQIVLEHLQSHHSQWVTRMGLDTGLKLNKDGTFALRFPPSPGGAIETVTVEAVEGSSSGVISGSIWTMYEPNGKKHFLCVTKGNIVGRYMLQDNTKPAWHSDKRSTPERVRDAVDEMIEKLEKEEGRRVV